jgi:hypothetical protein
MKEDCHHETASDTNSVNLMYDVPEITTWHLGILLQHIQWIKES